MSGSTTELNLKTAVDSDDTADYLTLSLADSLRTVDALFNGTTGHSHGGAHQGAPVTSIPIGAIPDGSITSAKIADGTIQGSDIADGSITSAKIADGTIQAADLAPGILNTTQQMWAYQTADATTTSGTYIDVPGLSITMTTRGRPVRIEWLGPLSQATAGTAIVTLSSDGVDGNVLTMAGQNPPSPETGFIIMAQPAAGAHTYKVRVRTNGGGTASVSVSAMNSIMVVTEL